MYNSAFFAIGSTLCIYLYVFFRSTGVSPQLQFSLKKKPSFTGRKNTIQKEKTAFLEGVLAFVFAGEIAAIPATSEIPAKT
jgi:hypothetical protein